MDDINKHLPLKEKEFYIMAALKDEPLYGYAAIKKIESLESIKLGSATFYRLLKKLIDNGLVEEIDRLAVDDEPRRFFRLSGLGEYVVDAEGLRRSQNLASLGFS